LTAHFLSVLGDTPLREWTKLFIHSSMNDTLVASTFWQLGTKPLPTAELQDTGVSLPN
jgi:hypothetical protein